MKANSKRTIILNFSLHILLKKEKNQSISKVNYKQVQGQIIREES